MTPSGARPTVEEAAARHQERRQQDALDGAAVVMGPRVLVYVGFFVLAMPLLGLARAASDSGSLEPTPGAQLSGTEQILVASGVIAWCVVASACVLTAKRAGRPALGWAAAALCLGLAIAATALAERESAKGDDGAMRWPKVFIVNSAIAYAILIIVAVVAAFIYLFVRVYLRLRGRRRPPPPRKQVVIPVAQPVPQARSHHGLDTPARAADSAVATA